MDYGQDGQACRRTFIYRIKGTEGAGSCLATTDFRFAAAITSGSESRVG
jgi:hypothetical protein